jgi:flagellar biosynthesis GTPase FlhF
MQTVSHTTINERRQALFLPLPESTLGGRLARAVAEAGREIARGPLAYLRAALLPERMKDWLPLRLASAVLMLASHPASLIAESLRRDAMVAGFINPSIQPSLAFITNVASVGEKAAPRRDRFIRILAVSASLHAVFIGYLIYLTINNMFAQFINFSVVSQEYRRYETTMVGPMYNPARPPSMAGGEAMSLEEIRERERERREEAERRQREKEEQERIEREKAEKERAEKEKAEKERQAQQKGEETNKDEAVPSVDDLKKVEINEKPLKEIIGGVYDQYKAGGIDLEVMNFTIEASFKIEPNGTLSNVKIIKSSGSKVIDESGRALLHAISESHALQLFASLSSGTIRFELTQNLARLTVTAFAPNANEAQKYADALGAVVFFSKLKPDLTPEAKELLSLLKVKTADQRINAEMSTSRARATEMMHARFDKQVQ